MKYAIIIEQANDGSYSAYVPDLPGCTSCGDTLEELRSNIREAIDAHIDLLRKFGDPVPEPTSQAELVDAAREIGMSPFPCPLLSDVAVGNPVDWRVLLSDTLLGAGISVLRSNSTLGSVLSAKLGTAADEAVDFVSTVGAPAITAEIQVLIRAYLP